MAWSARATRRVALLLGIGLAAAAAAADGRPGPEVLWVALGGETFGLELAADPETRRKGLSGRGSIPRGSGMLFVLPRPEPFTMVMRDCSAPIDVAFLDAEARVVAVYQMKPEPPRRPGETPFEYERRLRPYASGVPVQFAIETAGGRLREVGLQVGHQLPIDAAALARRAR